MTNRSTIRAARVALPLAIASLIASAAAGAQSLIGGFMTPTPNGSTMDEGKTGAAAKAPTAPLPVVIMPYATTPTARPPESTSTGRPVANAPRRPEGSPMGRQREQSGGGRVKH